MIIKGLIFVDLSLGKIGFFCIIGIFDSVNVGYRVKPQPPIYDCLPL